MEKRFNLFMDENTHKKIKLISSINGESMNKYILDAVTKRIDKDLDLDSVIKKSKK